MYGRKIFPWLVLHAKQMSYPQYLLPFLYLGDIFIFTKNDQLVNILEFVSITSQYTTFSSISLFFKPYHNFSERVLNSLAIQQQMVDQIWPIEYANSVLNNGLCSMKNDNIGQQTQATVMDVAWGQIKFLALIHGNSIICNNHIV